MFVTHRFLVGDGKFIKFITVSLQLGTYHLYFFALRSYRITVVLYATQSETLPVPFTDFTNFSKLINVAIKIILALFRESTICITV